MILLWGCNLLKFAQEEIKMVDLVFKTDLEDFYNEDDGSIQLKATSKTDSQGIESCTVFASTVANYADENFIINAHFKGKFILENITSSDVENDSDLQEKLGITIINKIYNKLNMYVSLLSQEVYEIPIYPAKINIEIKKEEV